MFFKRLPSDCLMKCFECIIIHQLIKQTKTCLNAFQFAYKHNRNSEDGTLLCTMHIHVLKSQSCVRILFDLNFFCLQYYTTTPHGMQTFETRREPKTYFLDCLLSFTFFSNSSSPSCTLVFPLYIHRLSTRHCPISYSFHTLCK